MNEKQGSKKIVAPRAVELIAIHICQQVEQVSAVIAGALALLPENAGNGYAGDLLRIASVKLDDIGDIEHLRRLLGAVAASGKNACQSPEADDAEACV